MMNTTIKGTEVAMRRLDRRLGINAALAAIVVAAGATTLAAPAVAAATADAAATAAASTGSVAAARPAATQTVLYFTKGEQLARVTRRAAGDRSLDTVLRALLAGPTRAEHRRGVRSNIPRGTRLLGAATDSGVATVDFTSDFAEGPAKSLQARLGQVVYTATRVSGVRAVRIAVDGVALTELGGLALDTPINRRAFRPNPAGGPPLRVLAPPTRSDLVREVQERLITLRYLPGGAADGVAGQQTAQAILAFQGWEGLPRDGRVTEQLKRRLDAASRPVVRGNPSRRIEVRLSRQVALLIHRGRVLRAIHVSTGKPSSPTPPGRFTVFRKELRSWSVPFRVWLPYASYFNRGIAFHESPDVPAYPASAGCVRVSSSDAPRVYRFATYGTPVVVR